jgi:hypothetical protein
MQEGNLMETKATAHLPNLDIEIIHSRSPAGDAERISVSVLAVPSFESFGRYLEAANPFLFWMRFAQTAWAPWFGVFPAMLPPGNFERLPPAELGGSQSPQRHSGGALSDLGD